MPKNNVTNVTVKTGSAKVVLTFAKAPTDAQINEILCTLVAKLKLASEKVSTSDGKTCTKTEVEKRMLEEAATEHTLEVTIKGTVEELTAAANTA